MGNVEKVQILVDHWKTSDGQVHRDPETANIHQAILNGEARLCPECKGSGRVDPYGDRRTTVKCNSCNDGYQYKSEVWK